MLLGNKTTGAYGMLSHIYRKMTWGKWAIISHNMNAKLALLYNYIIRSASTRRIIIVDPWNYTDRIIMSLPQKLQDKIIITGEDKALQAPGNTTIILVEPRFFPFEQANIIATATPGEHHVPRNYRRIRIRDAGDHYIVSIGGEEYRVKIQGTKITEEKLSGELEQTYELIREAMIEYGELTVRDTVFLVSKSLSIDRNKARRIIQQLVEKKYLRINKGTINIY
jgi:hypothetical protein